jgi:hypothetical protein
MKNIFLLTLIACGLSVSAQTKKVVPTVKPTVKTVGAKVATKSTVVLKSAQDTIEECIKAVN